MSDEQPEPQKSVRADALERAEQAWKARVAGATWAQAADVAGFDNGPNAFRAVQAVYATVPSPEREDLRALWRERLETLWRQALRDATDRRAGAVTAAVRIQQAAAALDGLDAPSRLEVTNPSRRELEAWVERVLTVGRPQLEEADLFGDAFDETEPVEVTDTRERG